MSDSLEPPKRRFKLLKRHSRRARTSTAGTDEIYDEVTNRDAYRGTADMFSAERFGMCSYRSWKHYVITPDEVKSVLADISPMVWIALVLAMIFVFICDRYDLVWDVEIAVVISPILFPLAFSINASYQRRERVLQDLAAFRASIVDLFWNHRDLCLNKPVSDTHVLEVRKTLTNVMDAFLKYVTHQSRVNREKKRAKVYRLLSKMSQMNVVALHAGVPPPLVGNCMRMLNDITRTFERLRDIREYMTPRSIRNFFKVFVFLIPLLLAPYFVQQARAADDQGNTHWTAYFSIAVVTLLFGALQSVQDGLDDPFDGVGEDDISLFELSQWPAFAMWLKPEDMPEPIVTKPSKSTLVALLSLWHLTRKGHDVQGEGMVGMPEPTAIDDDEDVRSDCTDHDQDEVLRQQHPPVRTFSEPQGVQHANGHTRSSEASLPPNVFVPPTSVSGATPFKSDQSSSLPSTTTVTQLESVDEANETRHPTLRHQPPPPPSADSHAQIMSQRQSLSQLEEAETDTTQQHVPQQLDAVVEDGHVEGHEEGHVEENVEGDVHLDDDKMGQTAARDDQEALTLKEPDEGEGDPDEVLTDQRLRDVVTSSKAQGVDELTMVRELLPRGNKLALHPSTTSMRSSTGTLFDELHPDMPPPLTPPRPRASMQTSSLDIDEYDSSDAEMASGNRTDDAHDAEADWPQLSGDEDHAYVDLVPPSSGQNSQPASAQPGSSSRLRSVFTVESEERAALRREDTARTSHV